jgi:uncharacterized membrane protein HdeD (DUF308 family)
MSFREIVEGTIVPAIDGAILPLLYALAFLFFIYGIATSFFSYNEEKRQEGKKFAIWGLFGLVLMFAVWGVIKLFVNVLTNGV